MRPRILELKRLGWSPYEIARQLGLSTSFVRNEINSGHLRCARFGRRIVVLDEHLDEYLRNGSRPREAQVPAG